MTKGNSAKEKAENLVATFGPPVTKGIELRVPNENGIRGHRYEIGLIRLYRAVKRYHSEQQLGKEAITKEYLDAFEQSLYRFGIAFQIEVAHELSDPIGFQDFIVRPEAEPSYALGLGDLILTTDIDTLQSLLDYHYSNYVEQGAYDKVAFLHSINYPLADRLGKILPQKDQGKLKKLRKWVDNKVKRLTKEESSRFFSFSGESSPVTGDSSPVTKSTNVNQGVLRNRVGESSKHLATATSPAQTWLDNQEFCVLLKISKRTAQNYRDKGIVAFSQIGSKVYYKLSDVHDLLESNRLAPLRNSKR